jgi:hypothetical protein
VDRAEQSTAELAQGILEETQDLVRLEIELAKQELRELLIQNAIAAGLLVGGGAFLLLALLVALPVFLVVVLDNHVLVAAIWLGAYLVLGVALVVAGRLALRIEGPRRTLASLEETKQWALRQIRSSSR